MSTDTTAASLPVGAFAGSIPRLYQDLLVPLIFEDYAIDLRSRLQPREGERILELACGTGVVTRKIAGSLPGRASLLATDLNDGMLDVARAEMPPRAAVSFARVDACELPYPDASFDALACQFGLMFFSDKPRAMREARRVLKPRGRYVFNVWDSLDNNPMMAEIHQVMTAMFPDNPPMFLKAGPFGYHDRSEIERLVRAAGFSSFSAETVQFPCQAPTAEEAARACVEGSPMLVALQERAISDPAPVTRAVADSLASCFGNAPCRSVMSAIVCTAS